MLVVHEYETPSEGTWNMVIRGMRNSWESWEKGDSLFYYDGLRAHFRFELGTADRALCLRLIGAGADHGKFMRQLPVVFDVTAPNYFWREFDTYHIGVTANSTSQMHTLGKHPFSADMFSFEDMQEDAQHIILQNLNWLRDAWINGDKSKGPNSTMWRAMLQAIPDAWNYRRTVSLNYQVLRAMYHARRYHRLREWRDFCAWIETLPYADLITYDKVSR